MLDRHATIWIRPVIDPLARRLARAGIGADALTVTGWAVGWTAAGLIALGAPGWGAAAIVLSRGCDALDGAVARLNGPTDRGGFLDITLDFLFYAAIPLGFAVADPARNALAAAVLLAAFVGTGTSFLAFAAIAARRGLANTTAPNKALHYLGGLTEGTETLAGFLAMCLWPRHFAALAYGFAILCAITIATRVHAGWRRFAPAPAAAPRDRA